MSQLDSNIPSNIYYGSLESEIISFARTTTDSNTFITIANQFLKWVQK